MSNFEFLSEEWPELQEPAKKAESLVNTDPRVCCFYARRALELAVEWLYQHDSGLKRPYDNNLSALVYESTFKNNLTPGLFLKVKTIKDVGNLAVHSHKPVTEWDALRATKELFHFLYWIARMYTRHSPSRFDGLQFDEKALPPRQTAVPAQTVDQLRKLEEQLRERDAKLAEQAKTLAQLQEGTDAEIERLRQEIAEAKKQNQLVPDNHDYSEAETRDYIIDLMLREAGWPLDKTEDREYEVTGMPNKQGVGYVDYVLWGDDGKPLAVVEAKRTTKDPRVGQQQAKLYADCLEQRFEQRPLIFYTNGYKTWFWDDLNYPPREAQGFYKKDELQLRFVKRLELLADIRLLERPDEEVETLGEEVVETLRGEVAAMNTDNFVVRPHLEQVEKYREPEAWQELNTADYAELAHIVAGLPTELDAEDETAKRFDVLMLKTQLAVLRKEKAFPKLCEQVKEIARRLEDKSSIPMIKEQLELIQDLQQDEYWADITLPMLPMLEDVRKRLRDLVKFIDKKQRKIIYTDFEDELGEAQEVSLEGLISASDLEQYRKKALSFLKENENHIAIHKLKHNVPITKSDIAELERILFESGEMAPKDAFEKVYGKQESLGLFIRKLIGLDREAAKQAFNEYLDGQIFNANQIRFVNLIIDYLTQNGLMDAGKLYESPFTDFSAGGLDGVFKEQEADRIVSILEKIRENAAA